MSDLQTMTIGAPTEVPTDTGDLRVFHAPDAETSYSSKAAGVLVVALMLGAAGVYTFATGMWNAPAAPPANQMLAMKEPMRALPPSVTPPAQPTVVPPTAPAENIAPAAAPQATAAPVKHTRSTSHASLQTPTTQPAQSVVAPAAPEQTTPAPDVTTTPQTTAPAEQPAPTTDPSQAAPTTAPSPQ